MITKWEIDIGVFASFKISLYWHLLLHVAHEDGNQFLAMFAVAETYQLWLSNAGFLCFKSLMSSIFVRFLSSIFVRYTIE